MLVSTWGFVSTRPDHPWIHLSVRAEQGAVLRISGAPYSRLLESLARVRSALKALGHNWPGQSLTIHVHPPCQAEEIRHLDVSIALALLAIQGVVPASEIAFLASHGMLGLDGRLHVPEIQREGFEAHQLVSPEPPTQLVGLACPQGQTPNFEVGLPCWECTTLSEFTATSLTDRLNKARTTHQKHSTPRRQELGQGWSDLHGEGLAKKWLCIAAKFKIPVMMVGPPGVGKTSLAHACRSLLESQGQTVPFMAPHPAGGTAGLLGSWHRGRPRAGAWAMADGGVLFLDEFMEWPRPARESLRHVMESGVLNLHRAQGVASWTSHPWIIAAMNACPCGQNAAKCLCQKAELLAYRKKLSAPLMERFPIQLEIGFDHSNCARSWQQCCDWMEQPPCELPSTWEDEALRAKAEVLTSEFISKRVQKHLKHLAECHASWHNRSEVSKEDVVAAFEVTWMSRKGWVEWHPQARPT